MPLLPVGPREPFNPAARLNFKNPLLTKSFVAFRGGLCVPNLKYPTSQLWEEIEVTDRRTTTPYHGWQNFSEI